MRRYLQLIVSMWLFLSCVVPVSAAEWAYIVHEGDTLWDFSIKNLKNSGRWKDLQKINGIKNPKKMQPGTRIRVPLAWVKETPVEAEVVAILGSASLTLIDSSVKPVIVGSRIRLGDQLNVGHASSLSVKFADGSIITLYEGSAVRFNHLSQFGDSGMVDTRLRLEKGRVDTRAIPAKGDGSRFEIQTPSAITAVRGTKFRTTVISTDDVSRIEVIEGKVAVKGQSRTRRIAAGFGTRVSPGQVPLAPQKLLAAPKFKAIPDVIRQLDWSLVWHKLARSKGYRIELSKRADFVAVLWSRVTENRQTTLPEVPDGQYYVRVRGIDYLGIEGLAVVARLQLDVHPQPPLPLKPLNEQVIRGIPPVFQWTQSANASAYRLQISASEDFSGPLLLDQKGVERASYSLEKSLANGSYYWRVASLSSEKELGPYSVARQFRQDPVPLAPELVVSPEEGKLTVSLAGEVAQQYHIQISESDSFDELIVDKLTKQHEMTFSRATNLQYMRIRVVESDGYKGPWGATQLIYPPQDNRWLQVIGVGILGILLF
ncbi:FecR domain-containing protein [Neptunomonas japonica]|nr:FecR domain-containing protein [Neptunomonas japonica]